MPPPTSCLIRSFTNYRRKHRVNCYTRSASRPACCSISTAFSTLCSSRCTSFLSPLILCSSLSLFLILATISRAHGCCSTTSCRTACDPWKYNVGPRVSSSRSQVLLIARERNFLSLTEKTARSHLNCFRILVRNNKLSCRFYFAVNTFVLTVKASCFI